MEYSNIPLNLSQITLSSTNQSLNFLESKSKALKAYDQEARDSMVHQTELRMEIGFNPFNDKSVFEFDAANIDKAAQEIEFDKTLVEDAKLPKDDAFKKQSADDLAKSYKTLAASEENPEKQLAYFQQYADRLHEAGRHKELASFVNKVKTDTKDKNEIADHYNKKGAEGESYRANFDKIVHKYGLYRNDETDAKANPLRTDNTKIEKNYGSNKAAREAGEAAAKGEVPEIISMIISGSRNERFAQLEQSLEKTSPEDRAAFTEGFIKGHPDVAKHVGFKQALAENGLYQNDEGKIIGNGTQKFDLLTGRPKTQRDINRDNVIKQIAAHPDDKTRAKVAEHLINKNKGDIAAKQGKDKYNLANINKALKETGLEAKMGKNGEIEVSGKGKLTKTGQDIAKNHIKDNTKEESAEVKVEKKKLDALKKKEAEFKKDIEAGKKADFENKKAISNLYNSKGIEGKMQLEQKAATEYETALKEYKKQAQSWDKKGEMPKKLVPFYTKVKNSRVKLLEARNARLKASYDYKFKAGQINKTRINAINDANNPESKKLSKENINIFANLSSNVSQRNAATREIRLLTNRNPSVDANVENKLVNKETDKLLKESDNEAKTLRNEAGKILQERKQIHNELIANKNKRNELTQKAAQVDAKRLEHKLGISKQNNKVQQAQQKAKIAELANRIEGKGLSAKEELEIKREELSKTISNELKNIETKNTALGDKKIQKLKKEYIQGLLDSETIDKMGGIENVNKSLASTNYQIRTRAKMPRKADGSVDHKALIKDGKLLSRGKHRAETVVYGDGKTKIKNPDGKDIRDLLNSKAGREALLKDDADATMQQEAQNAIKDNYKANIAYKKAFRDIQQKKYDDAVADKPELEAKAKELRKKIGEYKSEKASKERELKAAVTKRNEDIGAEFSKVKLNKDDKDKVDKLYKELLEGGGSFGDGEITAKNLDSRMQTFAAKVDALALDGSNSINSAAIKQYAAKRVLTDKWGSSDVMDLYQAYPTSVGDSIDTHFLKPLGLKLDRSDTTGDGTAKSTDKEILAIPSEIRDGIDDEGDLFSSDLPPIKDFKSAGALKKHFDPTEDGSAKNIQTLRTEISTLEGDITGKTKNKGGLNDIENALKLSSKNVPVLKQRIAKLNTVIKRGDERLKEIDGELSKDTISKEFGKSNTDRYLTLLGVDELELDGDGKEIEPIDENMPTKAEIQAGQSRLNKMNKVPDNRAYSKKKLVELGEEYRYKYADLSESDLEALKAEIDAKNLSQAQKKIIFSTMLKDDKGISRDIADNMNGNGELTRRFNKFLGQYGYQTAAIDPDSYFGNDNMALLGDGKTYYHYGNTNGFNDLLLSARIAQEEGALLDGDKIDKSLVKGVQGLAAQQAIAGATKAGGGGFWGSLVNNQHFMKSLGPIIKEAIKGIGQVFATRSNRRGRRVYRPQDFRAVDYRQARARFADRTRAASQAAAASVGR